MIKVTGTRSRFIFGTIPMLTSVTAYAPVVQRCFIQNTIRRLQNNVDCIEVINFIAYLMVVTVMWQNSNRVYKTA